MVHKNANQFKWQIDYKGSFGKTFFHSIIPKDHESLRMNKIYLINNWNLKIIFLKITNLYYFLSH